MEQEFNANNFFTKTDTSMQRWISGFQDLCYFGFIYVFFYRSKILTCVCSDVDATMLACIAFSCPNLESMEIYTSGSAVNRITGYDCLSFFFTSSV